ncbi:MAG: hypothetical protein FJZ01_03720 [Candidatus Sericytochromatia bacterium]|nr:hypothetical protein [Candidatus Tanganyikabacteria bacterium]
MGKHVRVALVAMAAVFAAGCGVGISGQTGAAKSTTVAAKSAVTVKAFTFRGIAGDGKIRDHFTIWEHQSIRFKAVVDNLDGGALTYKWDTDGWFWGKKDQPEANWSGPWDGWYDVTCTVSNAAGQTEKRRVSVKVWSVPTPPPIPHPPVP